MSGLFHLPRAILLFYFLSLTFHNLDDGSHKLDTLNRTAAGPASQSFDNNSKENRNSGGGSDRAQTARATTYATGTSSYAPLLRAVGEYIYDSRGVRGLVRRFAGLPAVRVLASPRLPCVSRVVGPAAGVQQRWCDDVDADVDADAPLSPAVMPRG